MKLLIAQIPRTSLTSLIAVFYGCATPPPRTPFETIPAPQKIQASEKAPQEEKPEDPRPPQLILESANQDYKNALVETLEGRHDKAFELWNQFLNKWPGTVQFERARYYRAYCLFHLDRIDEAFEPLKLLVHTKAESRARAEASLLLQEILVRKNRSDEALMLTYDLIPNIKSEHRMGLKRGGNPPHLDRIQRIKVYMMRAKIAASLGNEVLASKSLRTAKNLLKTSLLKEVPQEEANRLSVELKMREVEMLSKLCQKQVRPPAQLSEKEFLEYAEAHYGCVAPARGLMCTLWGAKAADQTFGAQCFKSALTSYKQMVEEPGLLKGKLPPPARDISPKQRAFYEEDMKTLIDNTVQEHAKTFRNLEECEAYEIF